MSGVPHTLITRLVVKNYRNELVSRVLVAVQRSG